MSRLVIPLLKFSIGFILVVNMDVEIKYIDGNQTFQIPGGVVPFNFSNYSYTELSGGVTFKVYLALLTIGSPLRLIASILWGFDTPSRAGTWARLDSACDRAEECKLASARSLPKAQLVCNTARFQVEHGNDGELRTGGHLATMHISNDSPCCLVTSGQTNFASNLQYLYLHV